MREQFENRPVVLAALAFALGIWLRHDLLASAGLIAGIALLRSSQARIFWVVFAILGVVRSPLPVQTVSETSQVTVQGRVTTVPDIDPDGRSFELLTDSGKWLVQSKSQDVITLGDEIQARGELGPLSVSREAMWAMRGVSGQIKTGHSGATILATGPPIFRWAESWRMGYRSALRRVLPENIASVADALCFNMANALDQKLYANLRRTGTVHIISASGAHVAILAMFLDLVLGIFVPVGRKWRLMILFAILVLYGIATGLNPPIIRSVFMAIMLLWAYVIRREPDGLSAVGCAALIALAISPSGLFEPSFQLSFAAMLGLISLIDNRSDDGADAISRLKAQTIAATKASVVAIYATTPIIAYWFGTFSVISVVANLLIAPALPPLIVLPMLAHGFDSSLPSLSAWLLTSLYAPLCGWLMLVVDSLGSLPWASTDLPGFPLWFWLPYYGVGLLWWRKRLETA